MPEFKGRLARLFSLGLGLAICLPLLLLLGFAYTSLQSRFILLKSQVRENQVNQIREIEWHFRNRFMPTLQEVSVQSTEVFLPVTEVLSSAEIVRDRYYQKYLPRLGLKSPGSEAEEQQSPIRLQIYRNSDKLHELPNIRGFIQKVLKGMGDSGPEVMNHDLHSAHCGLGFRLDCLFAYQVEPVRNPGREDFLLWQRQGEALLNQILEIRELWFSQDYEAEILPAIQKKLAELCRSTPWCGDSVAQIASVTTLRGLPETQFDQAMAEADPVAGSYYDLQQRKLELGKEHEKFQLLPAHGFRRHFLASGQALKNLKDDPEWTTLNSSIDKVKDFMVVGTVGISRREQELITYLGIPLEVRPRRWLSLQTNTGSLFMRYLYFPLHYNPYRFFMGGEPMAAASMYIIMRGQSMQPLFLQALGSQFELPGSKSYRPPLSMEQAEEQVRSVYQEISELRSYPKEKDPSSGTWWEWVAYTAGIRESAPWLLLRNREWSRATRFQFVDIAQAIREPDRFPGEDLRPVFGEKASLLSTDALAEVARMCREKRFGEVDFELTLNGAPSLGLAVRSQEFPDHLFFLGLPRELAYRELQSLLSLIAALILITMILAIGFSYRLSRIITTPIQKLTEQVTNYASSQPIQHLHLPDHNEITQMAASFEQMVSLIDARVYELKVINELNERMNSSQELSQLLLFAAEQIARVTGSDKAFLGFFEQSSRERLIGSALYGCQEPTEQTQMRLKQSYFALDNPYLVRVDANVYHRIHMGTIEGFLILEGQKDPQQLTEVEKFVLSFLAQTVSVVSKMWLDKVKADSMEGREVQLGLLPTEVPDFPALEIDFAFGAAKFLGGDFFDFVEFTDENLLGLVISDVSGKGIGPSLFGATCKAFLQTLSTAERDPGLLMQSLNDHLCEGKNNTLFATLFYGIYDRATRSFTYASAGHNKMLWFEKETANLHYLSAKGLPLGMFSPGKYQTLSVTLKPGDWIVLYTDGVTELENPDLALYGQDRLEALLIEHLAKASPLELKQVLEADMDLFRDGVEPSDDITYIFARVKES